MQEQEQEIGGIIETLKELSEDMEIPKNVKTRIDETLDVMGDDIDISLRIHKVLQTLEEVVEDKNLQPFSRTQIYNIISLLESTSL